MKAHGQNEVRATCASSDSLPPWAWIRALHDRVTFVVLAESVDGALVVVARPAEPNRRFEAVHGALGLTIWYEDAETVRMSLRNSTSGSVAYVQGGATLLAFAEELGLVPAS